LIVQHGNDQAAAEQVFFSLTAGEDSLELPVAFSAFSGEIFAAASVVAGFELPADPELLHGALL